MILVTGGTGLLGAHLLLRLAERGQKIKALKRVGSNVEAVKRLFDFYKNQEDAAVLLRHITWVDGDLTDFDSLEEAMHGCDTVYHCAALVSFHRSDKEALFEINTEGTGNMVNVALKTGIKRFNYVSSVAALGRSSEKKVIDESARWKNAPENSNYAVSKFLAENEVWRGAEEGLEVCIINPGIIIGPGDASRSSSTLFDSVRRGLPRTAPGMTGMVGALDAADALLALSDAGIVGQRFVLVSDNWHFHELATRLAKALGVKKPGSPAPRWMMRLAWLVLSQVSFISGKKARITRETMRAAYSISEYDGLKITKTVAFNYRPLEEAIISGADFFLRHH